MMADKSATRFNLIRHAETTWNRERRVQGQLDSPLTPDGRQQADQWGRTLKRLPWDCILASDTGRAVATATINNVHLNLAIETDPRLPYHLHGLTAAAGRLALDGLNARALT